MTDQAVCPDSAEWGINGKYCNMDSFFAYISGKASTKAESLRAEMGGGGRTHNGAGYVIAKLGTQ